MLKDTGRFLRAEGITSGTIATIMDEGSYVTSTLNNQTRERLEIGVQLDGEQRVKIFNVNLTSEKAISSRHGRDTKDWIGKKVRLNVMMTPIGKKAIIAEPV